MAESKTDHVPAPPFIGSPLGSDGYYKTTITDDDGHRTTGCGKTAEEAEENASHKYERSHRD